MTEPQLRTPKASNANRRHTRIAKASPLLSSFVRLCLEYFATNRANSQATRDIERLRQWYLSDNETRKRYMTWQQELDDMVYEERERTKAEKRRADEAENRAEEEKSRADEAESRADKYEKILKEHGLL